MSDDFFSRLKFWSRSSETENFEHTYHTLVGLAQKTATDERSTFLTAPSIVEECIFYYVH